MSRIYYRNGSRIFRTCPTLKAHEVELIGSGASLLASIYLFVFVDPLTHGRILLARLLKIGVYSLIVLGFNLWMRAVNRLRGKGKYVIEHRGRHFILTPKGKECMKEHIKMTSFFCAMFALMELPLFLSTI